MTTNKDWLNQEIKQLEKAGEREFVTQIKRNKDKSIKAIKVFLENLETEAGETAEASKILVKYAREGKISKEEETELRNQIYDIFKAVGIGIPFVLIPGSTLLLPFLIRIAKKRGINLLPTAFNNNKEEENQPKQDQEEDTTSPNKS